MQEKENERQTIISKNGQQIISLDEEIESYIAPQVHHITILLHDTLIGKRSI